MLDKIIVIGVLGILGQVVVVYLVKIGVIVIVIDLVVDNGFSVVQYVIGGVDLIDEVAVQIVFVVVKEKMGGLSGIVNIVGGFIWQMVVDGEIDGFDKMFCINLKIVVIVLCLVFLLFEGEVVIVNIGVFVVKVLGLGMVVYMVLKVGVYVFIESLVEEGVGVGVCVNVVLLIIFDIFINCVDMLDVDMFSWVKLEVVVEVIGFFLLNCSCVIIGVLVLVNCGGQMYFGKDEYERIVLGFWCIVDYCWCICF